MWVPVSGPEYGYAYGGDLIGFIYLTAANRAPICNFEAALGGDGYVIVQGWAFDPDDPAASIDVHVYVGGDAGSGSEGHVIAANQYREDVNAAHGIAGSHGFREVIQTGRRGELGVFAYAIDTDGGSNPMMAELRVTVTEPRCEAVTALPEGRYTVRSGLDAAYCLDVQFISSEDRAPLILCDWNGGDNQKFDLLLNDDSSYTLVAAHSGKAVEVFGAAADSGAAVSQHACNGTDAQRWWLDDNGDGSYSFRHKVSGLCIDVTDARLGNDVPIRQCEGNGTDAQRWLLVPVDAGDGWSVSVGDQSYAGAPCEPRPTVVAGGLELAEGVDYELSYEGNDGPGTGTVIVTGINGLTGSVRAGFAIRGYDSDGWVDLLGGAKGYARGGALVTGWMGLGSSKYWFGQDGAMATGWTDVELDGKTMHYYFNPASGNLVRDTWFTIGDRKYYFRPSGNLATGWATIADGGVDKKYYFEEDGTLVAGCWRDIDTGRGYAGRYYLRPSGAMATGWATIDGQKYFFRPSGNMATGFADVDDAYKRYFDADGIMQTGWQQIGGSTYYFRASGAMQTGTAAIDGVDYAFSDKGVLVG